MTVPNAMGVILVLKLALCGPLCLKIKRFLSVGIFVILVLIA